MQQNKTRKPFDMSSPEAKTLKDQIVHGTFVKQGTMVAFPPCFPGVTVPIPPDECHITALDVAPDGIIYGGTGGRATHLFVGMFHGVTGVIFDLGTPEGADHCAAVCCGTKRFLACVNGPEGGRCISVKLRGLPFDLLQEWGFGRPALNDLGPPAKGERIVHAVATPCRSKAVGVTTQNLFIVDIDAGTLRTVGQVPGTGRIAIGSKGNALGADGPDHLWRLDTQTSGLQRRAVRLPTGTWNVDRLRWARNPNTGLLYTADAEGRFFSFSEEQGFSRPLGRAPVAPVGPMAITFDGRLFGFCGEGVARMFCLTPGTSEVQDLGVAVSFLERRRYGYCFGDAVTGRDGQIFFGEKDDFGHLWIYFPRIQPAAS
jgi:hypothetical protein